MERPGRSPQRWMKTWESSVMLVNRCFPSPRARSRARLQGPGFAGARPCLLVLWWAEGGAHGGWGGRIGAILRANSLSSGQPHRTYAMTPTPNRTVFFVSDGTGITAETFGNSILNQFATKPRHVRRPFIDTVDKAHQVVREINHTADVEGKRPIIF